MEMLAFIAILSSVAAPLENFDDWKIDEISGLSLGTDEEDLPDYITLGAAREPWTSNGAALTTATLQIKTCGGKVVQINQEYDPSFFAFTSLVEKVSQKHGQPKHEAFGTDISIPGKGEAKGGTLRFRWSAEPNYFVMWTTLNGETRFSENLVNLSSCHRELWKRSTSSASCKPTV